MSWVTCQSPTSNETFAVNPRNVRRVVRKNATVSVIEFVDGAAISVRISMEDWLAAVGQTAPQASDDLFGEPHNPVKSPAAHHEDEQQ